MYKKKIVSLYCTDSIINSKLFCLLICAIVAQLIKPFPSFWGGPVSANYFYNFYEENSQKFFHASESPLILTSITTNYKFKELQQYLYCTCKPLSTDAHPDRKGSFLHQNSLKILRNIFIVKKLYFGFHILFILQPTVYCIAHVSWSKYFLVRTICLCAQPEFVNLLRSPVIDSQPGGPVRQPY
jgi:hypothetical protein